MRKARTSWMPVPLLAVLLSLLVSAAPAGAKTVTRQAALKVALRSIGATASPEMAVFSLPKPLRRGSFVIDGGPDASSQVQTHETKAGLVLDWSGAAHATTQKAWLFWADLDPGADFEHPSVLVLVSAAGKVLERR